MSKFGSVVTLGMVCRTLDRLPSTGILYHFPSCTNHDLAIDCLATGYPIPNCQVIGRWVEIVLEFGYFSFVIVPAMLPVAVPFVECEQLDQPVDWLPDQVVQRIAVLMAWAEQQAHAVVDKVAVAVVVAVEHVLVHVLPVLPWDHVVQQLEYDLMADVRELP